MYLTRSFLVGFVGKILLVLFFVLISPDIRSADNTSQVLLQRYAKELSSIESYLNNIKYLNASFVQEGQDGSVATGKFYLFRPGKMRVEYDKPAKILITVNGSVLAYQDLELEETSYLRTNSTPASFLTRNNISFGAKDVEITSFIKKDGLIKVSVMKKNRKEAGEFSLVFTADPINFSKMEVKNDMQEIAVVKLVGVNYDKVDDKLFIIKDNKIPE